MNGLRLVLVRFRAGGLQHHAQAEHRQQSERDSAIAVDLPRKLVLLERLSGGSSWRTSAEFWPTRSHRVVHASEGVGIGPRYYRLPGLGRYEGNLSLHDPRSMDRPPLTIYGFATSDRNTSWLAACQHLGSGSRKPSRTSRSIRHHGIFSSGSAMSDGSNSA